MQASAFDLLSEEFQSSPGFGAGRYAAEIGAKAHTVSFNPRPALGPGATRLATDSDADSRCFNPRPALGPGATAATSACNASMVPFQSSPGFGAGRYAGDCSGQGGGTRFNPRPALGPGATLQISSVAAPLDVSILARLWGRALRKLLCGRLLYASFQSSPGFGAGRYTRPP